MQNLCETRLYSWCPARWDYLLLLPREPPVSASVPSSASTASPSLPATRAQYAPAPQLPEEAARAPTELDPSPANAHRFNTDESKLQLAFSLPLHSAKKQNLHKRTRAERKGSTSAWFL